MVYREETLLNVIKSVTRNGRSIILTAVLALILVYLFSIIGFLFLKDDFTMEVDRLKNRTPVTGSLPTLRALPCPCNLSTPCWWDFGQSEIKFSLLNCGLVYRCCGLRAGRPPHLLGLNIWSACAGPDLASGASQRK